MKCRIKIQSVTMILLGVFFLSQQTFAQCDQMKISAQGLKVCLDNSVVLKSSGIPIGSKVTWNFAGQQITKGIDSARFIALREGSFSPHLVVTTPGQLVCRLELPSPQKIKVVGKPEALKISVDQETVCTLPAVLSIEAVGGDPTFKYTYIFESLDDPSLDYLYKAKSSATKFKHQIQYEGYKRIFVEIENVDGCKTNVVVDSAVSASHLIAPSFSFDDPKACDEKIIDFKSNETLDPSYSFNWSFEDAIPETSNLPNPKGIVFTGRGQYDVSLSVANELGCSKDFLISNAVEIGQAEDLKIFISDLEVCKNEEITLRYTGGILSGGDLNWELPNADLISEGNDNQERVIAYSEGGLKDVILTYNKGNCISEVRFEDTITVNEVNAVFLPADFCSCLKEEVNFENKSTSTRTGEVIEYQWQIKDENEANIFQSKKESPTYKFEKYGTYKINLKAEGAQSGCGSETESTISLRKLEAFFNVSNEKACLGENVSAAIDGSKTCLNGLSSTIWKLRNTKGKVVSKQKTMAFNYNFSETGKYSLELIIETDNGCKDSKIILNAIEIYQIDGQIPTAEQVLCMGEEVELKGKTLPTEGSVQYQWLVVDPKTRIRYTGTGSSLKFNGTEAGTFDIKLINRRNQLCADTVSIKKHLKISGIKAEILHGVGASCLPLEDVAHASILYNVNHQSNSTHIEYLWSSDKGDGIFIETPTKSKTAVTISKNGYYRLRLQVKNGDGCITNFSQNQPYEAGVIANFSMQNTACVDLPVKTRQLSQIRPSTFLWTLDSPEASTIQKPSAKSPNLIFKKPGDYDVKLNVVNGLGCKDSVTKKIRIIEFNYNFSSPETNQLLCAPALARFKAKHTNVDSFIWEFGDGKRLGTSHTETGHYYDILDLEIQDEYLFDVSLIAISKYGCADTMKKTSYIRVAGPRPKFTASPLVGSDTLRVHFEDKSEGVYYYLFDYNDKSSVDSNIMRDYTYALQDTSVLFKEYRPKMLAFDLKGCKRAFYGEPIKVYNKAKLRFEVDTVKACQRLDVRLKNFSTMADSFQWFMNEDDSAFSYERSPKVSLPPGLHSISLKAFNTIGNTSALHKKDFIKVYKLPTVLSNVEYKSACANRPMEFADNSYGETPIVHRTWKFNALEANSDSSNLEDPSYNYISTGRKSYSLRVRDAFGCANQRVFQDTIQIIEPREVKHVGFSYVSYPQNKVFDAHVSSKDTAGTHGFWIEKDFNNGQTIIAPLGEDETPFGPGLYSVRKSQEEALYQLMTIDDCRDSIAVGNPHRPMSILVEEDQETYYVHVDWTDYIGWDSLFTYTLFKKTNGQDLEFIADLDPETSYYVDSFVCEEFYEYIVRAKNNNSGMIAWSEKDTISPHYTLPTGRMHLLTTTVEDNSKVRINWKKSNSPMIKNYRISRRDSAFGWVNQYALTSDTFFIDSANVFLDKDIYYYQIQGVDHCMNENESSAIGNTIMLNVDRQDLNAFLDWNLIGNWPTDSTTYIIQRANESSDFIDVYSSKSIIEFADENIFFDEGEIFVYRIKAVFKDRIAYSNKVKLYPDLKVFIPNAFSPNGDGVNDRFIISALGAENGQAEQFNRFKMVISNRWGEIVHETYDMYEGWDGTFRGVKCPEGLYQLHLEIRSKKGRFTYEKGEIYLLK